MNNWSSEQEWYSLPYKFPSGRAGFNSELNEIGPPNQLLDDIFRLSDDQLWYISSSDSPSEMVANDVNTLLERYSLISQRQFEGEPLVTVYQFRWQE
jgi:hypothetical protein